VREQVEMVTDFVGLEWEWDRLCGYVVIGTESECVGTDGDGYEHVTCAKLYLMDHSRMLLVFLIYCILQSELFSLCM